VIYRFFSAAAPQNRVTQLPSAAGRPQSLLWRKPMTMKARILLSAGILLVDLGMFFFPLTAVFLIYIILINPAWFREFLENLDEGGDGREHRSS
jgi:hypothetical protein